MKSQLEAKLEKKCCDKLKKDHGCICIKLTTSKGIPDRLIIFPGGFSLFIEFKVGKNKQSKHQKLWEKRLKKRGHDYLLVYCWEDIERYFHAASITPQLSKKSY